MDPLLKWTGSKRWHVPQVKTLWDGKSTVVELFAGGAAVTFGLEPERAVLNDANPHLMNFYRWVKRGLTIDISLANSQALYYAHRDWFNALIASGQADSAEAAQLFYFLNLRGFNGICRFNQSGEFNTPWRPSTRDSIPTPDLEAYRVALQNVNLVSHDFTEVELLPGDFVYADPPYDSAFTSYTKDGFSFEQQEALALLLREHPGRVVITNSATDRIRDLYTSLGYVITPVTSGQRMHLSRGRSSEVIPEVMATNFDPHQ